jgi:alkanesulfonate monooxygenase SsuD/methylene tetrahydromethanopterin reductase-like flavin-dependent oxidoreductase (luciferase family)
VTSNVSGHVDRPSILLSQLGGSITDYLHVAAVVAAVGLERAWVAETRGPDALLTAGLIAREQPLEVGTAIVPVYNRSPALLAMAAADIVRLGGGRPVHLGLGAGGKVLVEQWHGIPFERSLDRMRDAITVIRQAVAGERTDVAGPGWSSQKFSLLTPPPSASDVRIYIGGMGPKMQSLAAAIADGLIVTWVSARILQDRAAAVAADLRAVGRDEADFRLVARAYAAVATNPSEVREHVRQELVEYVLSPPYANYFRSIGFDAEVEGVKAAFAAGDRQASRASISDALLDEVLIAGPADEVVERLREFAAAGAADVMVQPVAMTRGGDPIATIRALGELW